jgi:adenylylsulfate kinase
MRGFAIWITGLPGSGKSILADELNRTHPELVVLRMDELRKTVTPEPTYSEPERDIVYRTIVYMAGKLTELGHNVIIDATGNLSRWRKFARQLIPKFAEVYLRCPMELCIRREQERLETREAPKDIYKKGASGWPVPGMVAPYEEPMNPEVVIDTGKMSPREGAAAVEDLMRKLQPD